MRRPLPYDCDAPRPLVLAPMAELGHAAFRALVRQFGGCDLLFTEMLSAAGVVAQATRPSLFLIQDPAERDLVHQIAGAEPEPMGEAAAILAGSGAVRLDINMGCSAPHDRLPGLGRGPDAGAGAGPGGGAEPSGNGFPAT